MFGEVASIPARTSHISVTIRGHLDTADEWGNLQLSDATVQPLQRPTTSLPYAYVRARYVRFIHLPPTLDPGATVKAYRRRTLLSARSAARAATDAPRGKQGVMPADG